MTSPRWVPPVTAERIFVWAFLVVAATAWCSFTLAEFGLFTRGRLLGLGLVVVAAASWLLWRERRTTPQSNDLPVPRRHALVLLACLLLTAVMTSRPADYLINGSDASVYLNMAAAIEHRGGMRTTEPMLALLDDAAREAVFDRDPLPPHLLNFFPGGIQIAADGENLQPNFFHLVPATIAGVSALTGSGSGGLLILPVAGILTIAAVWLVAVSVSSPLAASTAAGLLTLNFAQVWYARFPTSESLTACFVLSGLWFAVRAARDGSRASGLLAGAALGLAACARLEVLLLVCPPVVAYLGVVAVRGRWTAATTYFALAYGVLTSQALFHALVTTMPYTQRILWRVFTTDWWFSRTTMLVPALVLTAVVMAWLVWQPRLSPSATRVVRPLLALLLLVAIVREWPQLWTGPAPLLFTPVGLVAMACGAVWLALDDPSPEVWLLVVIFVASALVYIDAPRSGRWYPLAWRRLVPVVLPIGLLLAGHITSVLWRQRGVWRWAAVGLVAFLGVSSGRQSLVLLAASPMTGLRDQLAAVAAALPPDTVLLTDTTTPSHFGLSLHFTFGQPVLTIRHAPETAAVIDRVAAALSTSGQSLMLAVSPGAAPGGVVRSDFARFDLLPAADVPLRWAELEPASNGVPARVLPLEATIELYRLQPRRAATLPLHVDIGRGDFQWRGEGFHHAEQMHEASARWTTGDAWIDLPQIEETTPVRLTVRLAAPRPPGHPAATAMLLIDDLTLGVTPELSSEFTEVTFDLAPAAASRLAARPASLTIRATPFVPRDAGLGDDARQLGVVVDWLRFDHR